MNTNGKIFLFVIFVFFSINVVSASEIESGEKLFKKKCALCHAVAKKKLGPAVNAMSPKAGILRQVIFAGKKSMPAYGKKLTEAQIDALVKYIIANQ